MEEASRVQDIAKEIISKVDKDGLKKSLDIQDKEARCGQIGLILRAAVNDCNLSTYRGIEYWWNPKSGYWQALEQKEMTLVCQTTIKKIGMSAADIFKREQRIVQMMRDNMYYKQLNPKKGVITFSNVTLDVDSGKIAAKSPEFDTIYALDYEYDAAQPCPKWIRFLDEVMPDMELRAMFQEYLGCIFIDRQKAKLEKILYLLGSGSNGKGVIFETLKGLIGANNITNYDLSTLASVSNEYAIANVDGKMLNYCSDADKVGFSNSKAKNIISGEPVPARLPYGQPFTAFNIPVMMVNANEMPATNDHTYGAKRRLMIIPMDVVIPDEKQNHRLHLELAEERSGILNWIFEGRKRLIENDYKFSRSEAADLKLREYEIESNSVLLFLQEQRMYFKQTYVGQFMERVGAGKIYSDYRLWCDTMGLKPFSQKMFSTKMKERGYISGRYGNGVSYAFYPLLDLDDYRKKYVSGTGMIEMGEYSIILGGKEANENLADNILSSDKEPNTSMQGGAVELVMDFGVNTGSEDVDDDEVP